MGGGVRAKGTAQRLGWHRARGSRPEPLGATLTPRGAHRWPFPAPRSRGSVDVFHQVGWPRGKRKCRQRGSSHSTPGRVTCSPSPPKRPVALLAPALRLRAPRGTAAAAAGVSGAEEPGGSAASPGPGRGPRGRCREAPRPSVQDPPSWPSLRPGFPPAGVSGRTAGFGFGPRGGLLRDPESGEPRVLEPRDGPRRPRHRHRRSERAPRRARTGAGRPP